MLKVGSLPGEGRADYQTLAGFILFYLGRVLKAADHFQWNGLRFEIMDMDGKRIDKVLVSSIQDHVDRNGGQKNTQPPQTTKLSGTAGAKS